jgi:6-phosphogluconolactonase
LLFFEFSAEGKLSEIRQARYTGVPGAGPRHVAFHPDGRHLFLLNELDNTLAALRRDGDGVVQTAVASTLPADFSGHSQASAIRVSSDGRFVFTGNRGGNSSNLPGTPPTRGGLDAISIFEFDPDAESVTLRRVEPSHGLEPRDFILAPNGNLIVGNQDTDTVITFSFDPDGPSLSPLSTAAVPSPACVILVP